MKKLVQLSSLFFAITLILLVMVGLMFRATLYWDMPVAPGEAIGVSDMIELIIFVTILGFAMLSLIMGLIMLIVARYRNYQLAIFSLLSSLLAPPIYFMLHSLIPRIG